MTQSAETPFDVEVDEGVKSQDILSDAGKIMRLIGQLETLRGIEARQKVELRKLNRSITRKSLHAKQNRKVTEFLLMNEVSFIPSGRHVNFDGTASEHLVPWTAARMVFEGRPIRGKAGRSRREAVAKLMDLVGELPQPLT